MRRQLPGRRSRPWRGAHNTCNTTCTWVLKKEALQSRACSARVTAAYISSTATRLETEAFAGGREVLQKKEAAWVPPKAPPPEVLVAFAQCPSGLANMPRPQQLASPSPLCDKRDFLQGVVIFRQWILERRSSTSSFCNPEPQGCPLPALHLGRDFVA